MKTKRIEDSYKFNLNEKNLEIQRLQEELTQVKR